MCVWQVVANQDTASRQLGAMRAEIIALQQELMQYRMVFVVIAVDAPSSLDKVHLTGDDDGDDDVVVSNVFVECRPWGTGIRGLLRGMATLPQGNQELLVVRDKVGRPPGELGVSKSMECDIFPFSALTLLVGDRKGIRPVKNWMLVCWW